MSRSGYSDNYDYGWHSIMYSGAVKSAIRGKRGQQFLREMLDALDALPTKRLIAGFLIEEGEVCALGAVGLKRGLDMSKIDVENPRSVADAFGIAPAMAREIEYQNDDDYTSYWNAPELTPEQRFAHVRGWVEEQIKP